MRRTRYGQLWLKTSQRILTFFHFGINKKSIGLKIQQFRLLRAYSDRILKDNGVYLDNCKNNIKL